MLLEAASPVSIGSRGAFFGHAGIPVKVRLDCLARDPRHRFLLFGRESEKAIP